MMVHTLLSVLVPRLVGTINSVYPNRGAGFVRLPPHPRSHNSAHTHARRYRDEFGVEFGRVLAVRDLWARVCFFCSRQTLITLSSVCKRWVF